MLRRKFAVMTIVFSMTIGAVFAGISILPGATEAAPNHAISVVTGDPGVTFRDIAFHEDMNYAIAVGENATNDGVIYSYDPRTDSFGFMMSEPNKKFNGVAKTQPYGWIETAEMGDAQWTYSHWEGTLDWHIVDPLMLPPAGGSGTSHGVANSGHNIWWFGFDPTSDYNDPGTRCAGSMVSNPVYLPEISTMNALVFYHWFEVEGARSGLDQMIVSIKNSTDTTWTPIGYWDSDNSTFTKWRQEIVYLPGWFLGNTVQLNFTFDSVDASFNGFAGWHLDNIVLYTNDVFVAVGEGPGYSAYSGESYFGSSFNGIDGVNSSNFNDVVNGNQGATFLAVGDSGAVRYFNNSAWHTINGAGPGEVLTGVDFNGSYFFIVGYDTGNSNHGVAYYITEWELMNGFYNLHPIRDTPAWAFNDVKWSNRYKFPGVDGMAIVVANGTVKGLMNPEPWRNRTRPMSSPPARRMHSMVYNSDRDRFVLFGGRDTGLPGPFGDTWVYNAQSNIWLQAPAPGAPTARMGHAMAYDSRNNIIVLFGGDASGFNGETWTYDLNADIWTQKFPVSPPSARWGHTMTYNSASGLVVLFGGQDSGGYSSQTWTYNVTDGPEGTWNNVTDIGPSPRYFSAMTYDESNDVLILFGGNDGILKDDTWVFSGNTWIAKTPVLAPDTRFGHSMTYAANINSVFFFAGNNGTSSRNDLWIYNVSDGAQGTWQGAVNGVLAPYLREFSSLSYYPNGYSLVAFGGDTGLGMDNQTWLCDLRSPWTDQSDSPVPGCNAENFTAVAWDKTGKNATFTGINYTSGKGVIYQWYTGNQYVSEFPDTGDVLNGHELYSLAFLPGKRKSNEEIIAVGGSSFKVKPYMVDQTTTITINTEFPHIYDLQMWKTSDWAGAPGPSTLNTQIDPNDNYTFFIEGNYSIGGVDRWSDLDFEVYGWFDAGVAGSTSAAVDPTWSAGDARTRQFFVQVLNDVGGTFYPAGAPNEFSYHSHYYYDIDGAGPGDRYYLYLNVTLEKQTWAADTLMAPPPLPGQLYDQDNQWNDAGTWDFSLSIYDRNYTDAYNETYEEFGVKQAVSITASGNPSGNAPPGSADVPLATPSTIVYSSNTEYFVNVSLATDLRLNGVSLVDTITADNIGVANTHANVSDTYSEINGTYWAPIFGRHFVGAGPLNSLNVWGNGSSLQVMPRPWNGTQTAGVWDTDFNSNVDFTEIYWWATVPVGTTEGVYWANIVVSVEDY